MYGKKKTTARFTRLGLLPRKWFEKKKSPLLLVLQEKEDISSKRKKSLESALHGECWNRFWLAWSLFPKKCG